MATLARTADRLYWGARYIERAEDTARIVRAYHDLVVDYPSATRLRWEPLASVAGSSADIATRPDDPGGEATVVHHLLADRDNPASIVSVVRLARDNLRTTREVMPREAWQAVNQLSQYVDATASAGVARQRRDHFLERVIHISRRLDGIVESTMSRSDEYRLFRLGRLLERADMTTRVLGVAAAGILQLEQAGSDELVADEVRWMSVLRSVSALQMYQRAARGPIEGIAVVRFLLSHTPFPRSVRGCFTEMRTVLAGLPSPDSVLAALDVAEQKLAQSDPDVTMAHELDRAMDRVQVAISDVGQAIHRRYVGTFL
jgi:uncharacterized alpha-E superfamily protein